jgi:pimeloyl-ACP methyl ester carboxylesterase
MDLGARERSVSEWEGAAPTIRRRHVVYVSGYDRRGTQEYYRLFQRECDRFRRDRAVHVTLEPLTLDDDDFAHWNVDMAASGWEVSTHYDFLRLERFVRSDMDGSLMRHILRSLAWIVGDLASGAQYHIFRASWRFGLHLLGFQVLLLAWLALAILIGLTTAYAMKTSLDLPVPLDILVSLLVATGSLVALRPLVHRWFGIQITACWVTLRRFSRGRPTWLDQVIEGCARRLIGVAKANKADELVLVGHSTGGAIAAAALARALELDPDLGRRGPRVVLLTLGSVMPAVALHPAAQRMRDIVGRLAVEPSVAWIDCQSRKDVMNFLHFDPVGGIGVNVGAERCNPLIWPVRFRDMVSPEYYRRFRWNFFRLHYQYIMAGDRPSPYDYVSLIAGPTAVAEEAQCHQESPLPSLQNGASLAADCGPHDALAHDGGIMEAS